MFTHQFSTELLNIVYEIIEWELYTIESYRKSTEVANQVRKRVDLKLQTPSTSIHKAMLSEELNGDRSTLFWFLKLEKMG